jgi:hypothetical protein
VVQKGQFGGDNRSGFMYQPQSSVLYLASSFSTVVVGLG